MSFFKDLKPVYTNNNNHSTSVVSLAKEIHTSHNRHTDDNNINNNNNIARINKRNKKDTVINNNTHLASLNGLSQYWHVEKGLFIDPNDIPQQQQQQQQQQRSSIERNIIQLRIQNTMNNTDYNSTTEKKNMSTLRFYPFVSLFDTLQDITSTINRMNSVPAMMAYEIIPDLR